MLTVDSTAAPASFTLRKAAGDKQATLAAARTRWAPEVSEMSGNLMLFTCQPWSVDEPFIITASSRWC